MIEIKPCSSFLDIDSNGYVLKKAEQSLKQNEWQSIINDNINYYKEAVADLVSVYVRGNVAKGIAVKNISDLDSFFISAKPVTLDENYQD